MDIGTCLSYGFERLKANPAYMIVGYLIVAVGSSFTGGILLGPLLVGFQRGLMKEDQGRPAEIGDVFSGFSDFVPALVAALLSVIATQIGTFLCIIPGLLIAPIMSLSLYHVAAGEKDGIEALKKSWAIIQNNMVGLAITNFVIALVCIFGGGLLCGVGIFLTLPIMFAAHYKMAQSVVGGSVAAGAPKMTMGGMPPPGMPPMGR